MHLNINDAKQNFKIYEPFQSYKMGPLQNKVTWYKKKNKTKPCWMPNDVEGQEKQEITSFKKLISFLFKFH